MGSFTNIIQRDQLFQLFSISWYLQKKVNEGVYLLELIILLIIKETFSSNFSIALRDILHMHFVVERGR